ncbi:hypothetical protein GLYMA_16G108250v4 [Glycine max]|nr:hypothetical protein GLYMA_16G108250v4 [Glycine max]KAH1150932.1 hypothetical protein GYH30_044768 [Glycine max]
MPLGWLSFVMLVLVSDFRLMFQILYEFCKWVKEFLFFFRPISYPDRQFQRDTPCSTIIFTVCIIKGFSVVI